MLSIRFVLFAVIAIAAAVPHRARARSVLMISIDGLRADDLTHAQGHGLDIPNLRQMAARGVWAEGVRGVLPTVTYPSHTTMITGVSPARHGIANNVAFDPLGKNLGGWMWYSQDIRVPTLWDTVKAKGGVVASIGWPVSVGKREIDYNVPEFWRVKIPEDEKLLRAVSTAGMPDEIARLSGVPFAKVALDPGDIHQGMDDARMEWVVAMMARYKPDFMTVHLVELDGARHKYGPYSPQARAILAHLDDGLGRMINKLRAAEPGLVVAIVSDHGFLDTAKGLNLEAALAADGLLSRDSNGKIASWDAFPWIMGGSAAIILRDPSDQAVEGRVRQILKRLAAEPANGIDRVLERQEIARLGGTADAAFWVGMKAGYAAVAGSDKALVRDIPGRGAHGYTPDSDGLRSVFMLFGPGIAQKRLGTIDMRDIAPTIGAVLDAQLPQYDGKVIEVTTDGK